MMHALAALVGFVVMVAVVLALAALLISPLLFVRYRKLQRSAASLEARMLVQLAAR